MAKRKPDKLSQEVAMALAAGMSYGKWKAMQQPVAVEEKPIPEGWRKCEYCGKPFKKAYGKRYCDLECREQAYKPRAIELQREQMRKYRERNGWRNEK